MIAFLAEVAGGFDPDDRSIGSTMTRGMVQTHRDWVRADDRRAHIRREWATAFESVDVMITPVTPVAAVPHDTDTPMDQRTIEVDGVARGRTSTRSCGPAWPRSRTCPPPRSPRGEPPPASRSGSRSSAPSSPTAPRLRVAALAEEVLGGFVPPPFPFRGSPA